MKIITLKPSSQIYQDALGNLADPPKDLYWIGKDWAKFANIPRIAIVGSRKLSPYGKTVIDELIEGLVPYKVVIISGLALGTDGVAHRAAITHHLPTIAVLPTPIEHIYPAGHRGLARDILVGGGALCSEYTPASRAYKGAMKYQFIARNRIIAALADAILIPEAAARSGSLHTASFGLELGRTVMAVPGNITSSLSGGTNNLIKHGATPITSAQDIIDCMALSKRINSENSAQEVFAQNPEEQAILSIINSGISDGSEILASCGLPTSQYLQTLTMLEITGRITALGNDKWSISL